MRRSFLLLLVAFVAHAASAQCGPLISTFPYDEGFEAAPAWTSGGNNNDWAWGTPAHPDINSAGGGTKSWCVGGLTGTFYELDAQSWLASPCFDFSAYTWTPHISFKIYWETERTYDGMVLQYSLDQGSTWDNVGAFGDAEDCWNQNWYNTSNVTNLDEATPKHGWSGRAGGTQGACQGGQGSEGWVVAEHCMPEVMGQPSVKFRFLFGSGTTCNSYDGIAIDDIHIDQAPGAVLGTSFVCNDLEVDFAADVDCAASITWYFGDPASGAANNTANGTSVSHTFSGPGTYTVNYQVSATCGDGGGGNIEIIVLGLNTSSTSATCGQANGSATVQVEGSAGPFTYDWEPGNASTATATGLVPGTYTVTVTGNATCPATATVEVDDEASNLAFTVSHTDVTCAGAADGTASVNVTAGSASSFAWSPFGGDLATANGLEGGTYTVVVSDGSGCDLTAEVIVAEPQPVVTTLPQAIALCDGEGTTLEATTTGGTGPYTYTWSPDGPLVEPEETTVYTVNTTDDAGCNAEPVNITVNVGAAVVPTLSVGDEEGCATHCTTFAPSPAGMAAYFFAYGDGQEGASTAHCYPRPGSYAVTLTVTDAIGCSGQTTLVDAVRVHPTPVAGFNTPDVITEDRLPLSVSDASSGATEWLWDLGGGTGDVSAANPVVDFAERGCYTLRQVVVNDPGCSDTAQAVVCVEGEFILFVPNTFTPDDNGINDGFLPITSVRSPTFYELVIFDRWGGELFSTADSNRAWDGANAPSGLYPWRLSLRDSEGKLRKAQGHVLLLR